MKLVAMVMVLIGVPAVAHADFDQKKYNCKSFLGRAKQSLCPTEEGHNACMAELKKGAWDLCFFEGDPYKGAIRSTPAEAEKKILAQKCTKAGPDVFECSDTPSHTMCATYLNGGGVKVCRREGGWVQNLPNPNKDAFKKAVHYVVAYDGKGNLMQREIVGNGATSKWTSVGNGMMQGDVSAQRPALCIQEINTRFAMFHKVGDVATSNISNPPGLDIYNKLGKPPYINFYAACKPGGRIDVVTRLGANKVGITSYENGKWKSISSINGSKKQNSINFDDIGGDITGDPSVVQWGAKVSVFARGKDGYVWWNTRTGDAWSGWQSLGGVQVTSDVSPVALGENIQVFARGKDNKLQTRLYANGKWSLWFPWGGPVLVGTPAAATWDGHRVDVFARDSSNALIHFWKQDDGSPIGVPGQYRKLSGDAVVSDIAAAGVVP